MSQFSFEQKIEIVSKMALDYCNENGLKFKQYNQKFAELIVRECAEVAKETRWAVPPSQEQIARGIQQHFGVEEPKGYQPTGWVCPKCGTDRTKAACPRGRGAATDGSCPMFGVAQ